MTHTNSSHDTVHSTINQHVSLFKNLLPLWNPNIHTVTIKPTIRLSWESCFLRVNTVTATKCTETVSVGALTGLPIPLSQLTRPDSFHLEEIKRDCSAWHAHTTLKPSEMSRKLTGWSERQISLVNFLYSWPIPVGHVPMKGTMQWRVKFFSFQCSTGDTVQCNAQQWRWSEWA